MVERTFLTRMIAAMLALLGLLDTTYLTLAHYRPAMSLVCPVGGGCETVQTSRWSTLPPGSGIPVALIGLIGYGVMLLLALATLHRDALGSLRLPPCLLLIAGGGWLFSLYLTALQVFVIHAICFWCVTSALLETGIVIAALVDWRAWRKQATLDKNMPSKRRGVMKQSVR